MGGPKDSSFQRPRVYSQWKDIHALFPDGTEFFYRSPFDLEGFTQTVREFYDTQVDALDRIKNGPQMRRFTETLDGDAALSVIDQASDTMLHLARLEQFLSLFRESHHHAEAVKEAGVVIDDIMRVFSVAGGITPVLQHRIAELSKEEVEALLENHPALKREKSFIRRLWNDGVKIDYSRKIIPNEAMTQAVHELNYQQAPDSLGKAVTTVIRNHQKQMQEAEELDVVSYFLNRQGAPRPMYNGMMVGLLENVAEINRLTPKDSVQEQNSPIYTWEKTKDILIDAFGRCAPEMGEIAERAFNEGWIHAASHNPRAGITISSLAEMEGMDHPRISVRFDGSLSSIRALAHEMGHLVHQQLTLQAHGDAAEKSPHYLLREIPSHFAEFLMRDALLDHAKTDRERVAIDDMFLRHTSRGNLRHLVKIKSEIDFHHSIHEDSGNHSDAELEAIIQKNTQELGFTNTGKLTLFTNSPFAEAEPLTTCSYPMASVYAYALYQEYQQDPDRFREDYLPFQKASGLEGPASYEMLLGERIYDESFWKDVVKSRVEVLAESFTERQSHLEGGGYKGKFFRRPDSGSDRSI